MRYYGFLPLLFNGLRGAMYYCDYIGKKATYVISGACLVL